MGRKKRSVTVTNKKESERTMCRTIQKRNRLGHRWVIFLKFKYLDIWTLSHFAFVLVSRPCSRSRTALSNIKELLCGSWGYTKQGIWQARLSSLSHCLIYFEPVQVDSLVCCGVCRKTNLHERCTRLRSIRRSVERFIRKVTKHVIAMGFILSLGNVFDLAYSLFVLRVLWHCAVKGECLF